ncbi:MAG: hypothetical protein HEQ22_09430 [Sphingopyxis sp.]|uniref:hypothetical protein n=1 Tax=Sphingopyxis sp. TaxID=1908224 RepID=UPI003D80C54E
MRRSAALLSLLAALALPAAVHAEDAKAPDELIEIDGKQPVAIKPDRAYLLFRTTDKWFSPVFLRIPTEAEVAAFYAAKQQAFDKALPALRKAHAAAVAKRQAAAAKGQASGDDMPGEPSLATFDYHHDAVQNLNAANLGKALVKDKEKRLMLVEAPPGNYVLYGAGNQAAMMTCLCLGTVGFEAKAGQITDLGTIPVAIAWQPSDDPVLKGETGLGASVNGHWALPAVGLVPPDSRAPVPAALAGKPVVPASFRAVGKFVAPPVFTINRLAPVAGLLAYDRGRVIDGRTGEAVPDNY